MKIAVISHSNVVPNYRGKLNNISQRHHVSLIVPKRYKENGSLISYESTDQHSYNVIPKFAVFGRKGWQHFHFYLGLYRTLNSVKPDLILLEEEPRSIVSAQVIAYSRVLKVPVVWCSAISKFRNWRLEYGFFNPRRYFYPRVERFVFRHTRYAIAITPLARDILKQYGFSGNVEVIPFNASLQFSGLSTPRSEPKTILFVGRLIKTKGIEHFLRLIGDSRFRGLEFVIVGKGDLETQVRELLNSCSRQRLSWYPSVPNIEMADIYMRSDILILPSVQDESTLEQLGRVLIENISHGNLSLGSNLGGIPFVLNSSDLLFESDNYEAMANLLYKHLTKESWSELIRRDSYKYCYNIFSEEAVAAKIVDYAEKICSDNI